MVPNINGKWQTFHQESDAIPIGHMVLRQLRRRVHGTVLSTQSRDGVTRNRQWKFEGELNGQVLTFVYRDEDNPSIVGTGTIRLNSRQNNGSGKLLYWHADKGRITAETFAIR